MSQDKKSKVEGIKESSSSLRGEIAAELQNDTDHFGGDSVQLLKHHGTYQQDNRDERAAARAAGDRSKHYSFMVRTRVPGGKLTSEQLLAELALGDELGCGNLRVTSRQALQLHGVLKTNLKQLMRRIQEVHLTTLGACGDVNRNTMCCPVPYANEVHQQLQKLASEIAEEFSPRTKAYHDVWLIDDETGERQLVDGGEDVEPLYGKTYLPRKFKIGIALPHDNCIDVYANDIGLLAVVEQDRVVGFNVLAGGGMGVTPSNKKTYPALGKRLGFVTPEQVVDVCRAIIEVQRDHGNRADRKIARMKYLVDRLGVDEFRRLVETNFGTTLQPPHPADVHESCDHLGWEEQGDGRWYYGLNVENGRLADTEQMQLKTAVREVCEQLSPGIRLTAHQSVLFTDVAPEDRTTLEQILTRHQVLLSEQRSTARRWSMACVAWPTCGLAITESERALPGILDNLEQVLHQLDLQDELFSIHMTGCPNGCVRPYNCDIGIVGKARGRYTLLLGGNRLGTRLNFIYKDLVPEEEIVNTLTPVLHFFQQAREPGETLGDFCHRLGKEKLLARCEPDA
jgi:sulfite reductase (ferredoxin)